MVLALPQYDHRLVDHFVQKCYLLSTAPGMPHGSGDLLKSLFQELRIDSARTMPSTVLEGIKTEPTSSASLSLPYTPSIVRPHKRSAPAIRGRGQMLTLMASNDLNLFSTAGLRQSRRKEKLRPRGDFADLGWSDDDGGGVKGDIVEFTLLIIGGGTIGRGEEPANGEAAPLNAGRPGEVALPEFIAAWTAAWAAACCCACCACDDLFAHFSI